MRFGLVSLAVLFCTNSTYAANTPIDPLRLDGRIEPLSEAIELTLDPGKDDFFGIARIELFFHVATNAFRFHAKDIGLGHAVVNGLVVSLKQGEAGIVTATAPGELKIGRHTFEVAFTNRYANDGTALFKVVQKEKSFLFTQMQPVDARRAFPCWDEPAFKVPWRITLSIPAELEAVSNMPIAQSSRDGPNRKIEFGRSPPMPSYLVAIAVGDFEFVPIPGQLVPGRIVTTKGQGSLAAFAAQEIPALLAGLEDYFGTPYPYPKLDHLAAPELGMGAMENVGAIIYADALLLGDVKHLGYRQRRDMIDTLTHEMSHMWFGDLVTMSWWDDLWLNESFASWLAAKIAARVHPELSFEMAAYDAIKVARATDTQPSVKAIRRSFGGGDNFDEAFDALSYNKGQSILTMAESWMGEEKFREALRLYLSRHRWGNARSEDLWEAFAESGNAPLREVLRRYVVQPGMPELTFKRLPGDRIEVRQERYRTITGKKTADQTWHVPIVIRYGGKDGERKGRFLLTKEQDVFSAAGLGDAKWIYPNESEAGHYTWSLESELTMALTNRTATPLSPIERLGVLSSALRARGSGKMPADKGLLLSLGFVHDPEPEVKLEALRALTSTYDLYLTEEDRPVFSRLVRRTLRPLLDEIGFQARDGEPMRIGPLRSGLLGGLGMVGDDAEVIKSCQEMALRQIDNPRSVEEEIAYTTLRVATLNGDAALLAKLKEAFEKATAPDVRMRFLSALGGFKDPALARAVLDYALTKAVKPTEFRWMLIGPRETVAARYEWLVNHYDEVKAKLNPNVLPSLVNVLNGAEADLLEKGRAFFLSGDRKTPLAEVEFTKVAEGLEYRTALRERGGAELKRLIRGLAAAVDP